MDSQDKIGKISKIDLKDSSFAKIAESIFNTKEVTNEQLMFILDLDLNMSVKELTISAGETRQMRQYESNNYHLSMKLDLGDCQNIVLEQVKSAKNDDKMTTYFQSKKTLYAVMREKYIRNESYLRNLISAQKIKDGIKT